MIGWHFSNKSETLNYNDGRKIGIGIIHVVDPPIKLCKKGLHASKRLIDALEYAAGPILWKVELSGEIIKGVDKCAATHRKYLARLDCSDLLEQFARACALSVAHLWNPPDVVMRFLCGDGSARAAAGAAAWAAAQDAARDAARAAAGAAAGAAAWAAALAAAWAAAWDAAQAAAWAAAQAAARDAAGAAAWAAAVDEQYQVLTEYVLDAMEKTNDT